MLLKMKYLFELSKEHKTLPKSEIFTTLKSEGLDYEIIETDENALVIKTNSDKKKIKDVVARLSYTFCISEFFFSCKPALLDILEKSKDISLENKGSIAIKYKNRSENIDSRDIIKTLAEIFVKDRPVDLNDPELEIRCLITDNKLYVGLKIAEIKRSEFEKRKVQNRPFFSPISLHPRLARALVNLSSVKENDNLLDPFCGTGGILIEAGLMKINIIASDIEEKMIKGCKKTLDYYKIDNYKLFCSDIEDINKKNLKKVDSIVTDLPYGKSTTTKGEDIKELYKRSFRAMRDILKNNGRAVVGLSNKELINLAKEFFSIIEIHQIRVHRSLIRYFVVFEK